MLFTKQKTFHGDVWIFSRTAQSHRTIDYSENVLANDSVLFLTGLFWQIAVAYKDLQERYTMIY